MGTAALLALAVGSAAAQSVALQGMLGGKALLIVDGTAPKGVAAGESHKGVKVLSTQGDEALVEIDGKRHTLRVGDAPASVGGSAAPLRGNRIVITASGGGHFYPLGAINNKPVQFLVDTGATQVAMGIGQAERLGIDYRRGQMVMASTANGNVPMWRVRFASVRIGDVEVHDVEGSVLASNMPYVLLGNTFLSRFQLTRDNSQMVLERRF